MEKRLYQLLRLTLKYVPIVGALVMWCHVVCLCCGRVYFFAEWFAGFSMLGVLLLIMQAYLLRFCNLYKAFVLYDALVYNCIIFQRFCGFGVYLLPMRILTLCAGILLFAILSYKLKRFNAV